MLQKIPHIAAILFGLVMGVLALTAPGTCDGGDSIMHFIIANAAFAHPENFLNHWGKPLFTLLAAPFAYWGFTSMKIFNVIVSAMAIFFTCRIAQMLLIPRVAMIALLMGCAPMYITNALSGLTEPLLALTLSISLWLCLRKQLLWATILVSFTPFMRSEGLIICGVFALYLLFKRQFKLLPLLAAGHIVYGIAGYPCHKDFLWVLRRIPYATLDHVYGSGELFHFVKEIHVVAGRTAFIFLPAGLLYALICAVKYLKNVFAKQNTKSDIPQKHLWGQMSTEEFWLVYGWSIVFIVAHSLFWYLGIFASFGLLRVLIGIMPLLAIISLRGINLLLRPIEYFSPKAANMATFAFAALIAIQPYLMLNWQTHFGLDPLQRGFDSAIKFLGDKPKNNLCYFDLSYGIIALKKDFYDPTQYRSTRDLHDGKPIPDGSIVIWDDWYSVVEAHNPLEKLENDPRLILRKCFEEEEKQYKKIMKVCVFEKRMPTDL